MRVAQAAVLAVVEVTAAAGVAVEDTKVGRVEMMAATADWEWVVAARALAGREWVAEVVTALEMWAPEDEVRVTQSVPLVVASKVVACRVKGAAAETALEAGVMVVGQQASTTLRSWQCAMFGQASDRAWRPVRNTDWMSTVRNGSQCMQKRKRSSLSFFCLPVCVDRPSSVVPGSFTCS